MPGKNIKLFCGKPLIAWAIESAKAVKQIQRVVVSTDSEEIAKIAREFGAEVPFLRPSIIAQDNSAEWLAWQHALKFFSNDEGPEYDVMVSIPATAPLRKPIDISNCIDAYEKDDVDAVITVTDAHRNPYFNMVSETSNGLVNLVSKPSKVIYNRQDAPKVFDITTVAYVAKTSFVLNNKSIFSGKVSSIYVPIERSIDIDTKLDFEIAEFLFERGKGEPVC